MTGIRTSDGVWLDLTPDAEFELTIENPLLRDDRTPSSWSTDITFPPTTLNKRVFGYLGALMTEPSVKRLGATIASGGLGLFDGTLEYDGIDEAGNLVYTFSTKSPDNDWDVKIHELPGLLYDETSGYTYGGLLDALKAGNIEDVHLPLVINETLTAEAACSDYIPGSAHSSDGSGSSGTRPSLKELDWGNLDMKYRNSPGATSHVATIPAVGIMRLLSQAIGEDGAGDLSSELGRLVIFATWWTKFSRQATVYEYDIGGALPDIDLRELVKAVCSMFCAAVFNDRGRFILHTARAVLGSAEAVDWTGRVSDEFSSERVEAEGYELSYAGGESEASGVLETDGTVSSLAALLDRKSEEYEAVEHSGLGDIFSARSADVNVLIAGTSDHPAGRYETITEFLCDRLSEPVPAVSGDEEEKMSVQIGLHLVRCVPARIYWCNQSFRTIESAERMAALLPLPSVESDRPADAYVAVLHAGQASDKGTVMGSYGDSSAGLDITPAGLFDKYHKEFAEWVGKDRQRLKVSLDLSVYEATAFRMWSKVLILGRPFLVEKLTIRFRADSDDTETGADLIGL